MSFELLDEFNYHHRLHAAGGTAVVLFTSPTCGTCKVVEQRLPGALPSGVHGFQVNVQTSPGLARALEIFHLPTLMLYREGVFHAHLNTTITPTALQRAVAAALDAPAQEEP